MILKRKWHVGDLQGGVGKINPKARSRPLEGCHKEHPYESLVFKGGGAKGAIYPGAIRALEDVGVMPYIKRFAGASAGAVTAALLACGLSADQERGFGVRVRVRVRSAREARGAQRGMP